MTWLAGADDKKKRFESWFGSHFQKRSGLVYFFGETEGNAYISGVQARVVVDRHRTFRNLVLGC